MSISRRLVAWESTIARGAGCSDEPLGPGVVGDRQVGHRHAAVLPVLDRPLDEFLDLHRHDRVVRAGQSGRRQQLEVDVTREQRFGGERVVEERCPGDPGAGARRC